MIKFHYSKIETKIQIKNKKNFPLTFPPSCIIIKFVMITEYNEYKIEDISGVGLERG